MDCGVSLTIYVHIMIMSERHGNCSGLCCMLKVYNLGTSDTFLQALSSRVADSSETSRVGAKVCSDLDGPYALNPQL